MNRRTFIMGGIGAVGMLSASGWLFTRRPEFGRLPQGQRLARVQVSPHYKNGQFQNLVPVQVMIYKNLFFRASKNTCEALENT